MRLATEIIESYLLDYLPTPEARQLTQQARQLYARWNIEAVQSLLIAGKPRAAIAQMQEATQCSNTLKTRWAILQLLLQETFRRLWRSARRIKHGLKFKTVSYESTNS
jgi:hypothetical protein